MRLPTPSPSIHAPFTAARSARHGTKVDESSPIWEMTAGNSVEPRASTARSHIVHVIGNSISAGVGPRGARRLGRRRSTLTECQDEFSNPVLTFQPNG